MGDTEDKDKEGPSLPQEIIDSAIKSRKIFLWSEIDDEVSEKIVRQLIYMDAQSAEPITMYINSPGGVISAGLAIYDAMYAIKAPVATVVCGIAASMASFLAAVGTKGMRYAWPHSKVLIHQPLISGEIYGPAADLKIHAEEMVRTRALLNSIYAEITGKSLEQIEKDTDRDHYLSAEEARVYGLVDEVSRKL
ncbi:MAG: ATP-dependent Clp protease proteolytic subunit [Spirochaetota bacterium]|jgi:ATP-dependent Clp protease protease subunit|nr:ATP-dependent Clp protease proteolytic subunit [Spirochaetota bacterium]